MTVEELHAVRNFMPCGLLGMIFFYIVSKMENPRSFSFTRINPVAGDFDLVVSVCHQIGAYLRYLAVRRGKRVVMTGVIRLGGHTVPIWRMAALLPNFCFVPVPEDFFFDASEREFGEHPFDDVKEDLEERFIGT